MSSFIPRIAVCVLALALVAACSENGGGSGVRDSRTGISVTPTATTPAPYDPGPWTSLPGLARCGPQPPRLTGQRFERLTLRSAGRALPAVAVGRGGTVAVLVHQTDGGGFCGWLPFAARIAAVPGQAALAFDLCGYGASDCPDDRVDAASQVEQVRMAIDEAVRRFHPRRLVLVGASMGGSLAVLTAAVDRRPDAVVDLSGPDEWRDATVHERAAGVRAPLLVAMADSDGAAEVAAAKGTAEAAGAGSRFVGAGSGHGYALLEEPDGRPTTFSGELLDWISGA